VTAPVISMVGLVRDWRLPVLRPRGEGAFYLPGGKLEAGEAPHREVLEESGVGRPGVMTGRRPTEGRP
jgi:8-oxo-dGTP diphosphatase